MVAPTTFKPTPATLFAVLDALAEGLTLSDAMRRVGYKANTIFSWLSKARQSPDDQNWMCRWPDNDPDMEPLNFADAVVQCQRAALLHFRQRLVRDVDVDVGVPRVLRDASGSIIYQIDDKLVADFEGDADSARALGVHDPFYAHDANGARIPVVVHDTQPAAIRQHVARALLPGFNPSDHQVRDVRHTGSMLIGRATPAARPVYARPEAEPMDPRRAVLLQQLEDRMSDPNRRTSPDGPVTVFGRPVLGDPPERTVEPERKIEPAENRRAYQATTGRRPVS
jgi:hypothetical protein